MGRITTFGFMAAASVVLLAGTIVEARPNSYQSQGEIATPEKWGAWQSWEILDQGVYRNLTPSDPLPTAGDTVVVRSPDVIEVTDIRSVTSLTIDSGGRLNIDRTCEQDAASVARLTISAIGTPALVINADDGLRLVSGCSELRFETSITIHGQFGSIQGLDSDAAIVLAPSGGANLTLHCVLPIHGALVIRKAGSGNGYFLSSAGISADLPGGALTLDASLAGVHDDGVLPDCSKFWSVKAPGAVLRFDKSATTLKRGIRVGPGTLDVNQPVSTAGGLWFMSGGSITPNVAAFATLSFGGHCGSDCWWVLSPVLVTVRCH